MSHGNLNEIAKECHKKALNDGHKYSKLWLKGEVKSSEDGKWNFSRSARDSFLTCINFPFDKASFTLEIKLK